MFWNEVKFLSEGKRFENMKILYRNENIFEVSAPERVIQIFHMVFSRTKAIEMVFIPRL